MAENLRFNLEVDNKAAVGAVNDFFNTFEAGAAKAKSTLNTAFGQGVQTEIKIEFKNGQVVAKEVQNINQESSRLGQIYKAVNGEVAKTPNELRKNLSILKQLQGDTAKFGSESGKLNKDWVTLNNRIKETQRALNDIVKGNPLQQLGSALSGLAGRFALVQTLSNGVSNAISAIGTAIGDFVKGAAQLEVAQLSLKAFSGDAETARGLFLSFANTAEKTPFNLEQVTQAGKTLLAFGLSTEEAKTATLQLGIIAGATGSDLGLLARNLGQVKAQNRAFTRDLNQFATAGIPIFTELANVIGVSVDEVRALAEEGDIGFAAVSAAIENMTGKGSAFSTLADEIGKTWIGMIERLTTKIQMIQIEAVNAFNALNKAFGGGLVLVMESLIGVLGFVADNFKTIVTVGTAVVAFIGTFAIAANAAAIAAGIATAATAAWTVALGALNVAKAIFAALTGNYAALALAAGVAAGATYLVSNAFKTATDESNNLLNASNDLKEGYVQLTVAQANALGKASPEAKQLAEDYKGVARELDNVKKAYDLQVTILQTRAQQLDALYKAEIEGLKETQSAIKDKIQGEKDGLREVQEQLKIRYDDEKSRLEEAKRLVQEKLDLELDKLDQKTQAEMALEGIRKRELQAKASSLELSEKERLEAKVALEAIEKREEREKLVNKAKEDRKGIDAQLRAQESQYEADKKAADDDANTRIKTLQQEQKKVAEQIKVLAAEQKTYADKIAEAGQAVKGLPKSLDEAKKAVDSQLGPVKDLGAQYKNAADQAAGIQGKLLDAYSAAKKLAGVGGGGANRFLGGPVSGGSTYTVNEAGKEAFLSASGKLSMINAPSFGQWKAPSKGVVIPAHLTSQLDIPAGGVNLHSTGADVRVGRNSMGAVSRSVAYGSSDRITNNITIQSSSPVQDASQMMINVIKNRRRRRI